MKNLYIKKIYIKNFRGYEGEKRFDFTTNNQPNNLILLSGGNGYGKTSLLDAIEWCLTGTVKRIYDDYFKRCSTAKEQQIIESDRGLIRNVNSIDNNINVKIDVIYKGKEVLLERKFEVISKEVDGLRLLDIPTIESTDNYIVEELTEILKDTTEKFNDNFICSYDKNIEMYSKGRKEIYDIFSCLYSEFKEANFIKNKLDTVKGKLAEEKDILKKDIITAATEKTKCEKLSKGMENVNSELREQYPNNKIFDNEVVNPYEFIDNIVIDFQEKLKNQISILQNLFYSKIKGNTDKLYLKLTYQYKLQLLKQLEKEVKLKQDVIVKARGVNFEDIQVEEEKTKRLYNLIKKSLTVENIETFLNKVTQEERVNEYINKDNIDTLLSYKKTIDDNLNKINLNNERKSVYDSKSPVMIVMRHIVDNTETLIEYRKENDKCPVCGSEEFKNSEVGAIAKKFLGEKDIERQGIIKLINGIQVENKDIFKKFNDLLALKFNGLLKYYEDILLLKDDLKVMFSLCKALSIKVEDASDTFIETQIAFYQQGLKSGSEIDSYYEEQTIYALATLDLPSITKYKEDLKKYSTLKIEESLNLLSRIIKEFKNHDINLDNIIDIDIELLDLINIETKLNICKFINSLILKNELYNQIVELEKKGKDKGKEVLVIGKQITKLNSIVSSIKKSIRNNEHKEIERIAEPLDKIYRKITRNTNIKEIKLNRGNGQNLSELQIIDWNDKTVPFANVLSAGQISTLSLSIFLSKALLNNGNLRCYLMDEPIQTMDDLNIISFIDLIRFELESDEEDRFVDQLIISTCDNDLEKLIMHKIKSFNIPICNFNFQGQGKYERVF